MGTIIAEITAATHVDSVTTSWLEFAGQRVVPYSLRRMGGY